MILRVFFSVSTMAFPLYFLLLLFLLAPLSESRLSLDYYKTSCPKFSEIIRDTVTSKQISTPTTAAGTIRLFFHDCMVEGCDASILVSSNAFNKAERDADINLSLSGDAFDVVVRAKTALELSCPKIVSCADILAQATRDLITMVGGPYYPVQLGRKDGLVSKASLVQGNLPRTNMSMNQMIKLFKSHGFTVQEMVALSGAHTIGFTHCNEFADRLYNFNKRNPTDPSFNPQFATALKKFCANYTKDPTISVFNDVYTPSKFDNMYFQNVERGMGLLRSDSDLVKDLRTKPLVQHYATSQKVFFDDFARAMHKLSIIGVKTGRNGEVRNRCDQFNNFKH